MNQILMGSQECLYLAATGEQTAYDLYASYIIDVFGDEFSHVSKHVWCFSRVSPQLKFDCKIDYVGLNMMSSEPSFTEQKFSKQGSTQSLQTFTCTSGTRLETAALISAQVDRVPWLVS